MSALHPSQLRAATVVSVRAPVAGGLLDVDHMGLVSRRTDQRGLPFVYNCSKRSSSVKLEAWDVFTLGTGAARLHDLRGSLADDDVLARAHSRLGDPWDLWSANCEHFVRWCHGLEVESPQLQVGVGIAAVVGAVGVAAAAAAIAANAGTPPTRRRR